MQENTGLFLIISDYYLNELRNSINEKFIENTYIVKKLTSLNKSINSNIKYTYKYQYDSNMDNLNILLINKAQKINSLKLNTFYRPYECIGNWKHFPIEIINGKRGSLRICYDCGSRITPRKYLNNY